jgi:hypothetical protein
MLVRNPAERPSSSECLKMALFVQADVRDGWMDDHGNPLVKQEDGCVVKATRSLNAIGDRRLALTSQKVLPRVGPLTW